MHEISEALAEQFDRYAMHHPDERAEAERFTVFLRSAPTVFDRAHAVGHFTGSAWLVSADGERVLLGHKPGWGLRLALWHLPWGMRLSDWHAAAGTAAAAPR